MGHAIIHHLIPTISVHLIPDRLSSNLITFPSPSDSQAAEPACQSAKPSQVVASRVPTRRRRDSLAPSATASAAPPRIPPQWRRRARRSRCRPPPSSAAGPPAPGPDAGSSRPSAAAPSEVKLLLFCAADWEAWAEKLI